jgi:hypothetical protein
MYNERNTNGSKGLDRTYQALSRESPGFGTGNNQFNHPAKLSLNIRMKKHILHNTCIKTIIYAYYNKVPSFYIKKTK